MSHALPISSRPMPGGIASVFLLLLGLTATPTFAQEQPETAPATKPAKLSEAAREGYVKKILDYLENEYGKKAVAPYWVSRAMGVVSLARSPRATASDKLFDVLEKDRHDMVRLLAWQALLARTSEMDAKTFKRYSMATFALADKGAFRGALRVNLLKVMATNPPIDRTRAAWQKIFTETNAWEPQDLPVLDALADCLRAWKSPTLFQGLINLLSNKDHAVRAEYVLQRAGCGAPNARSMLNASVFDPLSQNRAHPDSDSLWRDVKAGADKWYSSNRSQLKEFVHIEGTPWRDLGPAFVAPPIPIADIDPNSKAWYQELELGVADTTQIEVVFLVDATGSMGDVLDWMRADIARMTRSFQLLCKEPVRLGLTFYRDKGDAWVVQQHKLTNRLADLEAPLAAITANGGGDIPEAVLEAMKEAIEKQPWAKNAKSASRVLILVGDAPPHADTLEDCNAIAKKAAAAGMRIHCAKVTTIEGRNNLESFDEIAKSGGGSTVAVEFGRVLPFRFVDMMGKPVPFKPMERPEVQTAVAMSPAGKTPGDEILVHVLADMISPQYRDRVEPVARTLAAYCQAKSETEVRAKFPSNTPPLGVGKSRAQER